MRLHRILGVGIDFEQQNAENEKLPSEDGSFVTGASDEARTRYLHLGKVALYQMSYTRSDKGNYNSMTPQCQGEISKNMKFFIIYYSGIEPE